MNSTNDIFQGLSILLLSEDDARGKALAKALRDQRARVGETNISKRESARGVDLAVVDARFEQSLAAQLSELRADVRGRWASLVTVDFTQLVMGDGSVLLAGLVDRVAPLVEADRALTALARAEESFTTSLAPLGPPRTLRALSLSGHTLNVELHAPSLDAVIEVSNELLVSAAATRGDKRWEAWSALVRILGLSNCEITVTRRAFTSFMNIMEPVDQALEVAAQERACSVHQIQREEAEAEARVNRASKPKLPRIPTPPPPSPATAWTSPAAIPSPPKPNPPTRPAGSLGPQRTLMGIMPGLPAPGIAANDVRALPPKPSVPEPPRYAHRSGAQSVAPKASMTLMGVAPSAIPGLAEQLRKPVVEPEQAEDRVVQREALKQALDENFDPPTVRHNSLPDLSAELPELAEDLSSAAHPLSSPLPPPPADRDEGEREPPPGMSFDDVGEEDQTMITPSHLAEELLAQALQGAPTERPPPAMDPGEPPTTRQPLSELLAREIVDIRPSAAQSLPESVPPPAESARVSSEPPANDPNEIGASEETLVVSRKPEKKSRSGLVAAIAALAAVLGLISYAAMRARPSESVPAPVAVAPVAPSDEPQEPEPVAPSEPGENPLVPLAPSGAAAGESGKSVVPEPTPTAAAAAAPSAPARAANEQAPAAPAAQPGKLAAAAQPGTTGSAPQPATADPNSTAAAAEASAGSEFDELLKKGQRLLAQRDAAAARVPLEQALALQADNPHVRASLAETLLKLGELPAALVHAQTAVKLRPRRGHYSVIHGDVLAAMGRADEAQAAFQRAYELDPNDAEAKRKAGF